ncbi:M15 family metallopeptidase [Sinanaerobacter sp. ZZT-01]|nr:M15 family metallopeptidase [Sinanaerobacter sp. ZZT-01]WRR94383.1 M15 family metallopeptidase [Sinanaerobacter sp. ZZT-01]
MKRRKRKNKNKNLLWVAFLIVLATIFFTKIVGNTLLSDKNKPEALISSEQSEKEGKKEQKEKPVQDEELLILVNKQHAIDETYVPDDLTPIKYFASDRSEQGRYMRKEAAEHFHQLVEGAKESGFELVMTTAYRSYAFQNTLYTNYVNRYGQAEADTFSAKPGQSEHQTGLAVDVSSPVVQYRLTSELGDTEEGKWMAEHGHEYGFILRFPLGKEEITGYQYEPWHLRYVGQPAADEIYAQGITLEEYLEE